ncbi:MAG: FAD-dependent oxidoreductase [Desulfobacterales bacterium]|nr:FAD-dependent oxidoreductase [Desulfobacterales bacterium]
MKLFEPVKIRGMELKNRFIMPAMHLNLGFLGKRAVRFYEERAKGGVGCINTAAITPDPFLFDETWEGKGTAASFVAKLKETLPPAAHKYGAKIGIQLWTGNMYPAGMWGGYGLGVDEITGDWVAPSARGKMRALSTEEIKATIQNLTLAAVKIKEAGFDFVDFNLAHGYLPNQFFSPIYNLRTDEYGGDLKRRMRFGIDLLKAARKALGEDFPIEVRVGAHEYRQKGITIEDSAQFAVELVKAGADIISASVADPFPYICPLGDSPAGTYVPLAEAIRDKVDAFIVGVGRINTLEAAEQMLARGKIDLVGIGRQLIADPHWVNKVSEGRSKDIIPCLSCNNCVDAVTVGRSAVRCAVNPFTAKEFELPLKPAEKPKKVFVIGGGPAGMTAATTAAARGHQVTLFEKEAQLGGQLKVAGIPPHKKEIHWLNDYLVRQVEQSNVTIRLNEEVKAELIEKEKPDAVVVSTGLTYFVPDIPGIDRDNVVLAEDVLHWRREVGQKVVIIGGELVGCETADFLGEKGRSVTVARRGPEMACKIGPTVRECLLARLPEKGVCLLPGVQKYEEVTDKGLVLIDSDGKRQTIEADTIVIAAGSRGNIGLYEELKGKVPELHAIGDCKEPRDIMEAISEGAKAGTEL